MSVCCAEPAGQRLAAPADAVSSHLRTWGLPLSTLLTASVLAASSMASLPARAAELYRAELEDSVERIEFGANGSLLVEQGSPGRFVIEADDEDALEQIEIDVSSRRLLVRAEDTGWFDFFSDTPDIRVHVVVPMPESIAFGGAGDLEVRTVEVDALQVEIAGAAQCVLSDIRADELELALAGAGDCTASGEAEHLEVAIAGAGDFDGFDLQTAEAEVAISGAGDASVAVSDALDVSIAGVGSVEYDGEPELSKNIAGLGSVTKR